MTYILRFSRIGTSYYLQIPILFVRREGLKIGDLFEIEIDAATPTYNLKKIGNNTGKLVMMR